MKVLVVAEQLRRPVEGGIGTYARGLLRGLAPFGEHVTLWASRPPGGGPDPLAALGDVVTSPLPAPALVRAWDRGLVRPPGHPDVVHATSFAIPPGGRAPMSVMVHDLAWRHFPEAYPDRGRRWHEAAHDIAPWLDYFWGALLRAYKEFEERVGTIERGRGAKGDRVRAEILKRNLPFSISEIEQTCPGVSRDMVRLVLRAMKTEGLIAPTGKGRGAKWINLGQRPPTQ